MAFLKKLFKESPKSMDLILLQFGSSFLLIKKPRRLR
jgi:hypothetical protein